MTVVSTTKAPDLNKSNREYDLMYDPIAHSIRTIIGFLQGLFKTLPSGNYKWSPDLEATEITITGAYPLTLEVVNARPAIVVVHGASSYLNTSMNNFETMNMRSGNKVYRDIIACNAVINIVSRTGAEASRLAFFVASSFKSLQVFLQRQGPFTRIGHDVQIGGESPPGVLIQDNADGAAVNVQVVVPFFVPHKWEVLQPAYKNDNIKIDMSVSSKDDNIEVSEIIISSEEN
jgi:hypothetical protein